SAEVVEVALAVREARRTVVAAEDDERALELLGLLQLLQQHADVGVERLDLAEVVGEVLADLRHVGQERGQLALQRASGSIFHSALPLPLTQERCVVVGPNQYSHGWPFLPASRKAVKLSRTSARILPRAASTFMPPLTMRVTLVEYLLHRLPAF